ncbi:RraA family protein [Paraburkholderia bannensis]|uniref:RraA family protein n=1 Tax=Paraburkholderia bannensis TaxID=765414 RepID=UPI002AB70C9D|nr:RraA family protein [Paraburkholderia bannensis]
MTQTNEYVRRLRRLDCCAVSDALDKLELGGVVSGVQQAAGNGRLAGRVITVKLGTGAPAPGEPRHLGTTAIELGGPDDVIVVEQRTGIEAGSWGGLLSLGAKVKGIAGVIADGPVRDIDEAREMQFAVFANALTARTARGRIVEKATNVPIEVFGVTLHAGDYVVADRSAVIFIRAADIERVLDSAEAIVSREARMAKAVLAHTPISQVMGGNYEFMLKD